MEEMLFIDMGESLPGLYMVSLNEKRIVSKEWVGTVFYIPNKFMKIPWLVSLEQNLSRNFVEGGEEFEVLEITEGTEREKKRNCLLVRGLKIREPDPEFLQWGPYNLTDRLGIYMGTGFVSYQWQILFGMPKDDKILLVQVYDITL